MPKQIWFSGRTWTVKASYHGPLGPGPNYFSDSNESVWVDNEGFLHLKIRRINGVWHSAEVVLNQSLGYGRYICKTASRVDKIDQNAVLGIFTYDHGAHNVNFRQIDIELSRWGNPHNQIGQFVIQPYTNPNNITRFPVHLNGDYTSHIFDWNPERVNFQMLHGHHDYLPENYYKINQWAYNNKSIEKGNEKFIINLWQFNGHGPSNAQDVEVVVKEFKFIPAN